MGQVYKNNSSLFYLEYFQNLCILFKKLLGKTNFRTLLQKKNLHDGIKKNIAYLKRLTNHCITQFTIN